MMYDYTIGRSGRKANESDVQVIGSICHNEDDAADPEARRVLIGLRTDGQIMASDDGGSEWREVPDTDKHGSSEAAQSACAKTWGGAAWDWQASD